MEESDVNYWVRKLKEAMAISEFHFRDAVIELMESRIEENQYED